MTQSTTLDRWLKKASSENDSKTGDTSHNLVISVPENGHDNDLSKPICKQSDRPAFSNMSKQTQTDPNVRFVHPQPDQIAALRRLNSVLLPIPYPDSFYKEITSDPVAKSLTLLAYWRDTANVDQGDPSAVSEKLIGAIRCRLLDERAGVSQRVGPSLYLSTLAVLAPYRSLGIATSMLDAVVRTAAHDHSITHILAHVWEANSDALEWYCKRGFKEVQHIPDYYRKLTPHGAKVMTRDIRVLDLL